MSPLQIIVGFSFGFLCALPSSAAGITVRFLANPPADSIVRYAVLRSEGPSPLSVELGSVPAQPGKDTLSFADKAALRGRAYIYRVVGIDAAGVRSEPSESTQVALPALNLPDTLSGGAAGFRWRLAPEGDPLSGISPLFLAALDTARFGLTYDKATRELVLTPRGAAISGWVVLRAIYFDKFEDRDSIWLNVGVVKPAALAGPNVPAEAGLAVPAVWSQANGSLRIHGEDGISGLLILDVNGATLADISLPGNGSEVLWDGLDRLGRPLAPATYLWSARAKRGKTHRSGRLRIIR